MLDFTNDTVKKYKTNETKLVALVNGSKEIFSTKVSNQDIASVVEELLLERKQETAAKFKEQAKKIIDSKIEFFKFVKNKKQEFENAVSERLKEFNKEMESLFQLVDNIETLRRDYESTLNGGNFTTDNPELATEDLSQKDL